MCWLVFVLAAASPTPKDAKVPKAMPVLTARPTRDGQLKEFKGAFEPKLPKADKAATAKVTMRAATHRDSLWLGVAIADQDVTADDVLEVTLYFPGSGPLAKGATYRFGPKGALPPSLEAGPAEFAAQLVRVATSSADDGWQLEVEFPARSLPRFQAAGPLLLTLCADYADRDLDYQGEPMKVSTCVGTEMVGGPTRLADDFRKALKLSLPTTVEGLEARANGWLGFGELATPVWLQSDGPLTSDSLAELVTGEKPLPAASVALNVPPSLELFNDEVLTLLTGQNPYVGERCIAANELRVGLYWVKKNVATRVLEWPASNCQLGRAMRVELSPDGNLELGYTNGATVHFSWSNDHFERAELGLK